jgi:hypothetical protein
MKKQLDTLLRKFYSADQPYGLCTFISGEENSQIVKNGGLSGLFSLFKSYASRWPLALKKLDGSLRGYFIPKSRTNLDQHDAFLAYDSFPDKRYMRTRLELANFILKTIARERKKKFVPIEFPVK